MIPEKTISIIGPIELFKGKPEIKVVSTGTKAQSSRSKSYIAMSTGFFALYETDEKKALAKLMHENGESGERGFSET